MLQEIVINEQYVSMIESVSSTDAKDNPGIIEGKEGERVSILVNKRMSSTKYFKQIRDYLQTDSLIMPKNCRLMKKLNNGDALFVIEEAPQVRTLISRIEIDSDVEDLKRTGKLEGFNLNEEDLLEMDPPFNFQVSFPYIVYIIVINIKLQLKVMSVFYRLTPISSYSDYLILTNLPNISDSHRVCLGYESHINIFTADEAISDIIDHWWLNPFNSDYNTGIKRYNSIPQLQSFLHWSYHTSIDPMFIFQIPWIHHDFDLCKEVDMMSSECSESSNEILSYSGLVNNFQNRQLPTINKNSIIERDPVDSICFDQTNIIISIGDEFILDGKLFFIDSFWKKQKDGTMYIDFENDEDETKRRQEVTVDFANLIIELIKEKKISNIITSAIVNDVKLKIGDYIKMYYPYKVINQISKIVKYDQDAEFLMKNSTSYYLLKNLKFDKIDIDNIEFNGQILKKGNIYNLINNMKLIKSYIANVKFESVEIYNNVLRVMFVTTEDDKKSNFSIDMNHFKEWTIIENLDNYDTPDVIRVFDNLLFKIDRQYYLSKDRNTILNNHYSHHYKLKPISDRELKEDKESRKRSLFTNADHNEIFIPGFGCDIHLKIGDVVVVADWDHPSQMTDVCDIVAFPEDGDKILIKTLDSNNVSKNTLLIELDKNKIYPGCVRKIEFEHGDLKAGDRIRATISGIANFPKSAFVSIIGFLTEGVNDPMVLCSNGCTVWASHIPHQFNIWNTPEKLERIARWEDVKINIDNIRDNIGDFVFLRSVLKYLCGMVVYPGKLVGTQRIVDLNLDGYGHQYSLNDIYFKQRKKYGFLTPRLSGSEQVRKNRISAFPNMFGNFIPAENNTEVCVVEKGVLDV